MLRGVPTAGCCSSRPMPGRPFAGCVCLQRPCPAGFVCLLAFAMPCPLPFSSSPRSVLLCPHPPVQSMCARIIAKATVCKLQELSRWQQQRGSAVAARAPCCIHPPFPVLQGLPCRQPRQGTAFVQPMRRCSLRHKRGRPRTACEQPAKFPTPAFCEPETACEQPGSLLTVFSFYRVH